MARLKADAISDTDLHEFVEKDSDFGFEMQVLKRLRTLQFQCGHSGTYQDPVTKKIRQFDIRARRAKGNCVLELAVECKNLRANCPLLISAVPRTPIESFHQVVQIGGPNSAPLVAKVTTAQPSAAYGTGEMVGKKTDQVGRDVSGELVGDDSSTFEKLNQAVNSCHDLVRKSATLSSGQSGPCFKTIVPVLVVPANLLWQVDYDERGDVRVTPRRVRTSNLFIDHAWAVETPFGSAEYRLSHLELVTQDGLPAAIDHWLGLYGFFAELKEWMGE